jgi:hypothetical protein
MPVTSSGPMERISSFRQSIVQPLLKRLLQLLRQPGRDTAMN